MKDNKSCASTSINWFPGHMVKTMSEIKSKLKLIDIVIEVVDSRLPISSRNHMIDEIVKDKPRIIIMNKYDLSDKKKLNEFKNYFESKNMSVVFTNAQNGDNINKVLYLINEIGGKIYKEKIEKKNIAMKPIYRVCIVGIPNVGKSTIINKLSKKTSAEVGNRPGVTKKSQWIRLSENIELMDTPGVLWPKLDENKAGIKLALTGNIKQEVIDSPSLAIEGIKILTCDDKYKNRLKERYKLEDNLDDLEIYEILEKMAKNRGCVLKGNEIDYERISNIFLDEFKNGKIGNFVLDNLKEVEEKKK